METKERERMKGHINSNIYMIYISYNNVRHPVSKTFTTIRYASPNYTLLQLTTLVDTSIPLI